MLPMRLVSRRAAALVGGPVGAYDHHGIAGVHHFERLGLRHSLAGRRGAPVLLGTERVS
jgi:hypothetical protein